ncbi:MAG: hypothetical protein JNK14_21530 [Chitinophagaceae bacterium]|nr:hypothetical protein [Chitinophagaceae bacterium]
MANYLLLRNNKESGPYSLDDLMQMGLKAYDLVWIQGKSAAWRYPSEVQELKPFAPVVEEQPFDRFYKKQTEGTKPEMAKEEIPVVPPEHEKYVPKRSVFVTMPGKKTQVVKPAPKVEVDSVTPVPAQQIISVTENPAAAQVKYSQPLDEIKEMYVKTLYDRKQKIARKGFLFQILKKAAVILLLIAVGVAAGLIIQSNANKKREISREEPAAQEKAIIEPPVNTPVLSGNDQPDIQTVPFSDDGQSQENEGINESDQKKQPVNIDKTVVNNNRKENTQPLSESRKEVNTAAASPGVDIDPATGERSRKVRGESNSSSDQSGKTNSNTEKRSFSTSGIADLVSVVSNDYKKVAFGGIRNLELTVTNDSKYTLDNVIVELQYIKPNELPLKTENVEFRSVGPRSTSTIRIPDTNRGIKVTYRIINVHSRQMDEVASGN